MGVDGNEIFVGYIVFFVATLDIDDLVEMVDLQTDRSTYARGGGHWTYRCNLSNLILYCWIMRG